MSRVDSLLDEGLERGLFAGVAAGIAGPGGLILETYRGAARVEPREAPVEPGTLWDLASLTKPLAGAHLTLSLVDAGALELVSPVTRFADVFRKTRFDGVTIGHLLTHTSGMADWFPCYVRGEGRAAYLRTLSEVDPDGPPGRKTNYSCLGYLVLASIVESVSAQPLDVFFRERVSNPLGLADDFLFLPEDAGPALRGRAAGGELDDATERALVAARKLKYVGFRNGVVNGEVNDGNAARRAAGVSLNAGLFGTLRAVLAAGRAWLPGNATLAEGTLVDATRDHTPGLGEPRGLGWQMATAENAGGEALGKGAFGHTGFTGTSLFVDPESQCVFVLLTNRLHPLRTPDLAQPNQGAQPGEMNTFRRRFHDAARSLVES